jgi:hypothetical protein
MFDAARDRLKFLGDLRKHRIARWVFLVWAVVGFYDTFGSELLPPDWAQKRPTVYQLIATTSGWLSWEAWLLIGAVILVLFALEYVARHKQRPTSVQSVSIQSVSQISLTGSKPTHDVWLFDAIWRAYFGEWKILQESEHLANEQEYQRLHDLAEIEIPQKALDGDLPIWGKRNGSHVWEPVPKIFWRTHEIEYLSLTNGSPHKLQIWSTEYPKRATHEWIELKTSRSVVEQLWKVRNQIASEHSASPLHIEVGENEPYFRTTGGIWDTKRTFLVKVVNHHLSKSAEFFQLAIDKIEPQEECVGPWSFPEIRTLPPKAYKFVELARYGEARDPKKYKCADSFFTVLVENRQPLLPVDNHQEYRLLLRATAHGMAPGELRCKLWVDENGRFRIGKI